ncbi:unnamed protein product [Lampetra planeri]
MFDTFKMVVDAGTSKIPWDLASVCLTEDGHISATLIGGPVFSKSSLIPSTFYLLTPPQSRDRSREQEREQRLQRAVSHTHLLRADNTIRAPETEGARGEDTSRGHRTEAEIRCRVCSGGTTRVGSVRRTQEAAGAAEAEELES